MQINPDFVAPCGLYCGVCAIYMADRDDNQKFKQALVDLYQGGRPGKGLIQGLTLTVVLGLLFTCVQAYEYVHAAFGFTDAVDLVAFVDQTLRVVAIGNPRHEMAPACSSGGH